MLRRKMLQIHLSVTEPIDGLKSSPETYCRLLIVQENKRNFRKQALHLKLARSNKAILKEAGEMKPEGRPSKRKEILEWRKRNPEGSIKECVNSLGVSISTAYKYWKEDYDGI